MNISEKPCGISKHKENEIRTRSRAEEKRERFKIVDNLTKVIDDVALNYSANHERQDLKPVGSEKRRNAFAYNTWLEPFTKITLNNVPQNQQRARKSFPTPSSTKSIFKQVPISINSTIRKDTITNSSPQIAHLSKEVTLSRSTPPSTNSGGTTSQGAIISNATTTMKSLPSLTSTSVMSTQNSTLTAVLNPTIAVTAALPVSATSLAGKLNESINTATMSHVILLPTNATVNYGSPINSVLGMVSCFFLYFKEYVIVCCFGYLLCLYRVMKKYENCVTLLLKRA